MAHDAQGRGRPKSWLEVLRWSCFTCLALCRRRRGSPIFVRIKPPTAGLFAFHLLARDVDDRPSVRILGEIAIGDRDLARVFAATVEAPRAGPATPIVM